MKFFIDNWMLLMALIAVLTSASVSIYSFYKKPTTEQLRSVKEWLLYAVVEAERYFGGGTGQLKLRYVYDMFIEKFPHTSCLISFEMFSGLVDEALEKMKSLLATNNAVKSYVED